MDKPQLYYLPFSPPCIAVQIVCDVLGIDPELKVCDILKGENMTTEFQKVNLYKTIPTFVDSDGFTLSESRAIITYLTSKYASGHESLYPKDLKKRALVDKGLHFDGSSLFAAFGMVVYPVIRLGAKLNPNVAKFLEGKLANLNEDLGRMPYIAGNELTIADLSLLASFRCIEETGIWDTLKLKNIQNWVKRIKDSGKIKNYDQFVVNSPKHFGGFVKEKLNSN